MTRRAFRHVRLFAARGLCVGVHLVPDGRSGGRVLTVYGTADSNHHDENRERRGENSGHVFSGARWAPPTLASRCGARRLALLARAAGASPHYAVVYFKKLFF